MSTRENIRLIATASLQISYHHIMIIVRFLINIRYKKIELQLMGVCFDLILNIPSTIFQLCRDGSSSVDPVLS